MAVVDEGLRALSKIKGLGGPKLERTVKAIGGEDVLKEALKRGDVSGLSAVGGISEKMAVAMVLRYRGEGPGSIIGTETAETLFREIADTLRSYMHTSYSRNMSCLMVPAGKMKGRQVDAERAFSYLSLVQGRDRQGLERTFAVLGRPVQKRDRQQRLHYILLAEDDAVYSRMLALGLDRRCLVLTPDQLEGNLEGDIVLVHSARELDESRLPITSSVPWTAPVGDIVPEAALDWYNGRSEQLSALAALEKEYGRAGKASEAGEILVQFDSLAMRTDPKEGMVETVEAIRSEVEASLEKEISELTLSGAEALSLLSRDEPDALREIYRKHARMASDLVEARLGQRRDLFEMRYPLRVDPEAVEHMMKDVIGSSAQGIFQRKVGISRKLSSMVPALEEELRWACDLDLRFGTGSFIADRSLHPFEAVEGWFGMTGAARSSLRFGGRYQPVDYHLGEVPTEHRSLFPMSGGSNERTAMLTGANSGGKTTLLETIAEVIILAKMGLPVPAERAFIPEIDGLFLYRPRRRLDAGGLEGFLKELLPLSLKADQRSFVMADELEAMTELDAAAKIIGVFMNELRSRGSFSVVVTHMADEVSSYTSCRMDGIEAKGLDERYDLIVDRTPKIGRKARSTPELILRKLEAKAKGGEKELYSKVLLSFEGSLH